MNDNNNVVTLTVSKSVEQMARAYISVINKSVSVSILPSIMLWGPPGVGKSQGIRQLAKKIEKETKKEVIITDVRLLLFNPIDLRGIPTSNEDKTLAVWLKPKIFQMDESLNIVNILFLDEISAAPPSVQAAAYQITLDRTVGEHSLPDNCIIVAAGNRVTDKSVAFKMPKALANRLCHIEIESDFSSWKSWAVSKGINDKICGFLTFRPDYLMKFDPSRDDTAFATPRAWEMVSSIFNNVSDDIEQVYPLIAGCIGVGTAIELRTWCNIYEQLPNIEEIFAGEAVEVPKSTDVLYALVSSMVSYARKKKDDLGLIQNSINYSKDLPPDFAMILLKDYMALEDGYRETLIKIPEFSSWLSKNGRYLNA